MNRHERRARRVRPAMRPVRHMVLPGHVLREAAPKRESIARFLTRNGWAQKTERDWSFSIPTTCIVNGEYVLRAEWSTRRIRPGDEVVFLSRPHGNQGGSAKSTLGLVAMIGLALFAPMIGGFLVGALGLPSMILGAATGKLLGAAIALGGSLLIASLISPKAGGQSEKIEQLYTISLGGNMARLNQPVAVQYGRLKQFPDYATSPYSEYIGNDQYFNALYVLTAGKYDLEKLYVDDTELWDSVTGYNPAFLGGTEGSGNEDGTKYDGAGKALGVEHAIYAPGEPVTLFPTNIVQAAEVSGQQLPDPAGISGGWIGGFIANNAGTTANAIAIDLVFPGGCFSTDSKGNTASSTVTVVAEYRPVNNAGAPTGSYSQLFSKAFTYATRNPKRFTVKTDVLAGRYEVRVKRTTAPLSGNGTNEVVWTSLRSYLADSPSSFANVTVLALRMKANGRLSEVSSKRIAALGTRVLPVWNGSAWADTATKNPIWSAYDMATNDAYGARVAPSKVDFAQVYAFATDADARGDAFNYIFKSATPIPDAFDMALKPCRSMHRWAGDTLSLIRDEWSDVPRMLLTDREIIRGSLKIAFEMMPADAADSVIVEYADEEIWNAAEVQYPPNSYSSPVFVAEYPSRIRIDGVTNREKAYDLAAFLYRQSIYRRQVLTFETEHDGRLLGVGDRIVVQSELPQQWGSSGEVIGRSGNTLTLSPSPEWTVGEQHFVTLRQRDGRPFGPVKVSQGVDDATAILDAVDLALVEDQLDVTLSDVMTRPSGGDGVTFHHGTADRSAVTCLVMSGRVRGDRVEIKAVVDAEEVHDADNGDVPDYPSLPPLTDNPAPVISGLIANFRQGVAEPVLDASWFPAAGALRYVAAVSYDEGNSWTAAYDGEEPRFSVVVDRAALRIRVQGIGKKAGAYSTADVEAPTIVIGPDTVSPTSLQDGLKDYVTVQVKKVSDDIERLTRLIASVATEQDVANFKDKQQVLRRVAQAYQDSSASITELATVVATGDTAFAAYQLSVNATLGAISSDVTTNATAIATVDGKLAASWAMTLDVNGYISGMKALSNGVTSSLVFLSDNIQFAKPGVSGGSPITMFMIANVGGSPKIVFKGDMFADGSITATKLSVASLSAISAAIGDAYIGSSIYLNGTNDRIVIYGP